MDTKREHRTHAEGSPRGNPYDLTYSPSGRLIGKSRSNSSVTLSASADMAYGYCDDFQPHAVKRMFNYNNGMLYDMRWDEAGNLGQVSMSKPGEMFEAGRFLFWTEDCCGPRPCGANRMHAAVDDRYYSYYAYDHSGERRLKLTGDNKLLDVNADFMATYTILNEPTLYPSAYMVLTNKGYTNVAKAESRASLLALPRRSSVTVRKHYYAGTERVAARLGGGGLDALYHAIGNNNTIQTKANLLFDQSLEQVNNRILYENDLDCIMHNDFAKEEFGHWIDGIPYQMQAGVEPNHDQFKYMMNSMLADLGQVDEPDVYFYHSDLCKSREQSQAGLSYAETQQSVRSKHLGSASWITDFSGMAVQHIQYLPYGEPYINQRLSGYNERFSFTGKERDEETGYGYFGARYMDHELMTMWLSVDPMADKYPNISPYAYCAWNPLKLVDPDGRDWYRNEETGSVTWQKGNSKTIEISGSKYSNIGETYLMRYDWGAVFYNQNEVQEVYEYQNLNDLATSEKGMNALAAKEGCILHPYNDSKGYATIGVGHLIAKRKVDEPIKKEWAWLDTRQEALALFRQDLDDFENGLRKLINPNVKLMQFQYDAIVSFAFNIGLGEKGGKEGFASSEFLRQLNNGVYNGSLMLGWSKPKEIIPRRKKEVNLFDNAIY